MPVTDEPRSPGWAVTLALTIVFTAGAGIVQQFPWVTDRSDARAAARDTMPVAAEPSTQTATPGAAPDAESIRANERAARLQEAAIRAAEADARVREEIRRAYEADLRDQERHVRAYARMMRAFQNWFELSEPPEPPQPPEPTRASATAGASGTAGAARTTAAAGTTRAAGPSGSSVSVLRALHDAPGATRAPGTARAAGAARAAGTTGAAGATRAACTTGAACTAGRGWLLHVGQRRTTHELERRQVTPRRDAPRVHHVHRGSVRRCHPVRRRLAEDSRSRRARATHRGGPRARKDASPASTYVGGLSRPWGPEAQQLLASKIVLLVRQFGFGAEERVKTILEKKGVNGVMEEIGLLTGDYARRLYFVALIDHGEARRANGRADPAAGRRPHVVRLRSPPGAGARRGARRASRSRRPRAYVAATRPDEIELRQASRADASHRAQHAERERAAKRPERPSPRIQSDYDRRLVLTAYLNRYGVEGLREPFGEAVQSIKSNYDRRQVLTQVARNGKVPPDVQRVAFDLVGSMSSDYDRAEILLAFVNAGAIDPATRPAFVSAAESIRSSHDQNRVLAALVKSERR